jgi:uracil phosphoribosyltransferase
MPLHVVSHPLIAHKMTILRDKSTSMKKFRELVDEITLLLAYEATRELPTTEVPVETPLVQTVGRSLVHTDVILTPILRAGLGMLHGMMQIIPNARVAYIGMQRNEKTKLPETYYFNVQDHLEHSHIIVVDPMLATAGSMSGAVTLVKQKKPGSIRAICLIACPEGEARMDRDHPDVPVYVAARDERLNENAYIMPGLGDAGDRMFGTP